MTRRLTRFLSPLGFLVGGVVLWLAFVPVRPWDDMRLTLWGETVPAVVTWADEEVDFGDAGQTVSSYRARYAFTTRAGARMTGETRGSGRLAAGEGERFEVEYLAARPDVNRPALTGGAPLAVRVAFSVGLLVMLVAPGVWRLTAEVRQPVTEGSSLGGGDPRRYA